MSLFERCCLYSTLIFELTCLEYGAPRSSLANRLLMSSFNSRQSATTCLSLIKFSKAPSLMLLPYVCHILPVLPAKTRYNDLHLPASVAVCIIIQPPQPLLTLLQHLKRRTAYAVPCANSVCLERKQRQSEAPLQPYLASCRLLASLSYRSLKNQ